MDGNAVLFCQRRIFAVQGYNGPNAAGLSSGYSDPQPIPTDVGCVDGRSILSMPDGIIFKAQKGWHLLGRDLSVRYIGEGVEEFNGNSVSAAVLLEDRKECRFYSADTNTTVNQGVQLGGSQLVYSYLTQQWSQFVYPSTTNTNDCYLPNDAVWWPTGGYVVSISTGDSLNRDTPGAYVDAVGANSSTQVLGAARTAFLHLGALGGYQRVKWLYLTMSAPTSPVAQLNILVDFDDVYSAAGAPGATGYYTSSIALGAIAFNNPQAVDIRHALARQKCKSVAFTFTEVSASSGLTGLQAMSLEVGMKRGSNKLPATQTVA